MNWIDSEILSLVGILGFGAAVALWWAGIPQTLWYRRQLKRWNALIASHLKKHVRHEKKLVDAFNHFELACNTASHDLRRRPRDWEALDAAMERAASAWRHLDALLLEYERARRKPSAPAKAPSS